MRTGVEVHVKIWNAYPNAHFCSCSQLHMQKFLSFVQVLENIR